MIVPQPSFAMTALPVLVVADEPQLVRGLKIALSARGYVVESARTASGAFEMVAERPPGVLLLDGALPDRDGVEACREFRRFTNVPILIMSAVGAERETVRALDAGADDYLRKPFTGSDLLRRLRAVLSRSVGSGGTSRLELGELVIDPARRHVTRAGAVLLLARTEFELIRILAERGGRTVTDRELLRAVWPCERGQGTRRLRITVARLRAMLEQDPSRPEYLISEPGIGYRLRGPTEALR
jgi:two-component system KDP operon response regulator KdpE